ncbi:MAG: heavy metal translocating P-type ATPase [Candidatus Nomurabacteria bacterium]|nr:heavy metal translocating P-type ATPase [Candidatus Nomurabacteria bacterium]
MKTKSNFLKYDILIQGFIFIGLILGGAFHLFHYGIWDQKVWLFTLVIGSFPFVFRTFKSIFKGKFGVDLIAIVAIFASFWASQYLTGVVILLMLSSGEVLEAYAQALAKRELTQLLNKAPSFAHIKEKDNKLREISVDEVKIGDILITKPGEVVPVDGIVVDGISNLDEAIITGESLPVEKRPGSMVYSGSVNEERSLEVRAIKNSTDSKYQIIVKLVKEAQSVEAPVVRLADRYALFFNIITFVVVIISWVLFKDPIRVLSILVVASPCPLILATPIAMISGISKAASRGIVIKNGIALEKLGEVKGIVFDKTGTLTLGMPEVVEPVSVSLLSADEVLRIAVSIDQLSAHVFARSLIDYAQKKSLELDYPDNFEEVFGQGVNGKLKDGLYFFGKLKYIENQNIKINKDIEKEHKIFQEQGKTAVYLSNDKDLLGYVVFADIVRPETKSMFESIREHNISRLIMLTGDKKSVAENIAKSVGITEFQAELLPEQKVEWLKKIQSEYGPVAMVGDGVNDAPALAVASVGIAMASHGATAASETGDVVIMVNNMHRVHDALHIAQSAVRLAKQSIFFGMGVSIMLMILAMLGYITPIFGAIMQEILDAIVIMNALRLNFEKIE